MSAVTRIRAVARPGPTSSMLIRSALVARSSAYIRAALSRARSIARPGPALSGPPSIATLTNLPRRGRVPSHAAHRRPRGLVTPEEAGEHRSDLPGAVQTDQ